MKAISRIFRSYWFWSIATIASTIMTYYAYQLFPVAVPIMQVDLTMDRHQAIAKAQTLAQMYGWGPPNYQAAASFDKDHLASYFIELEGGGHDALAKIIEQKIYSPLTWHIRLFSPNAVNETSIYFTPDGTPYQFVQKLPEDQKGAILTEAQARAIAEQFATDAWQINLDPYDFVSHSQETQPSERVDHTFVYERNDLKVAEAPYRLKFVVSGDIVSKLSQKIKVPEGFVRRYEHMRSMNNLTASAAWMVIQIFYLLICCIFMIFFFLQRSWISWRMSLIWAIILSSSGMFNQLNEWPLIWMYYPTALAPASFIWQKIISMFIGALQMFTIYFLSITAAESLGRKAFGHHPQLWKLWSRSAGASWEVLGRTLGGYLMFGFDMLFVVLFYFLTRTYLGWWDPAESLFEPNILATYLPWLSPVTQALNAGFWEECLFRAVPLATAALLGSYFNKRKTFITVALMIQAVVFGAGHASYAVQPAYARIVELMTPSLIWGGLYLAFGLLPTIILHYTYDLVLMSIPLWVLDAPGIWIQRAMIVLCGSFPLLIVLFRRVSIGSWRYLPGQLYNRAFVDPLAHTPPPSTNQHTQRITHFSNSFIGSMMLCGCIGLVIWSWYTPFSQNAVTLDVTRTQANTTLDTFLLKNNQAFAHPWHKFSTVTAQLQMHHYFIWQTAGKEAFKKLLGSYLPRPQWKMRYARFEGDIAQREEEFNYWINPDNTIVRENHTFSQESFGLSLTESQARSLVTRELKNRFGLTPEQLVEISAISKKQPNRLDWNFTFQHPSVYPLSTGQARIAIEIAGDKIVDAHQSIFIPETWQRDYQERQTQKGTVSMICMLLLLILTATAVAYLISQYGLPHLAGTPTKLFGVFFMSKFFIQLLNTWPTTSFLFRTSRPFWHQASQLIMSFSNYFVLTLVFLLFISALLHRIYTYATSSNNQWSDIVLGICVASIGAGVISVTTFLLPSLSPVWADYSPAGMQLPVIGYLLNALQTYIFFTVAALLFTFTLDALSHGGTRYLTLISFLLFDFGFLYVAITQLDSIQHWAILGTVVGVWFIASYWLIVRHTLTVIPTIVATLCTFDLIQYGVFNPWPYAWLAALISIINIYGLSMYWSVILHIQRK